jgi:hypothetical protein
MRNPGKISIAIASLVVFASPSQAGPPLPQDSIVDPCIVVCPAGDIVFRVEGRRLSQPDGGWPISVNLCGCPAVHFVPRDGTEPYEFYTPCDIVVTNDFVTGIADFPIRAGGTCSGASIDVASPLLLATRTSVASPDQDGDLTVSAYDLALATAKLGTTRPPTSTATAW